MKQKILKVLSLTAIALCSATTAWADRVAPTMPERKSPVDGGCYWLYNVDMEQFLGGSYNCVLAKTGTNLYLAPTGDYWKIRENAPDGNLLSGYGAAYFPTTAVFDYNIWKITEEGNYQRLCTQSKENSTPSVYLGCPTEGNNNHYLYQTQTENIDWLLWDATEAARYAAEKALYDALVATDDHGWVRDKYEEMYEARDTYSSAELNSAANELAKSLKLSSMEVFHAQNDFSILLISDENWTAAYKGIQCHPDKEENAVITAMIENTENAELSYEVSNSGGTIHMFVDDEEVNVITNESGLQFYPLTPGKHTIKWVYEDFSNNYIYFYGIGLAKIPLITVNCALPGSLGTEILYNVDNIKDVRNIKVIGELNAEDITRITMLSNAHTIDLSEATCTADIPNDAFHNHKWLHTIILPEGIKTIGNSAFSYSPLKSIALPSTLTTIKESAFRDTNLENVILPSGITVLESYLFMNCSKLKSVVIPDGVTEIKSNAFYSCSSLVPTLPSTLQIIGNYAFSGCNAIRTLVIPETVKEIESHAFSSCQNLEEITMPMAFYRISGYYILFGCNALRKLTLNSPTVVGTSSTGIINDSYRPNITLCVPDYLVVPYKLDPYWYNFGDIVGFPSENIKDYTLYTDLLLDSHSRINGDPNLTIEHGALRIEGDAAMGIDNFQTTTAFDNYYHNNTYYSTIFSSLSQVRSGCENITIKGDYTHKMKFYGSRWAFVSLPFDCKVSDITDLSDNHLHAVRYYDGAERAATGTGSSWKKYGSDDIIPAGQGFIIQVDGGNYDAAWVLFKSQDNASKQYVFSKKEFSKHLDKNTSNVESNQGWNLVGNPYQCYYNIHNLNFTAPITVWDGYNRTYAAYSIIDDDYALRPNEAFFVQCPSVLDAITFPVGGKQFDATILTQNASQRRAAANSSRKMLNLALSNDKATDQTRIVINEEARLVYETNLDASKFMSIDNTVAQLYTLDDEGTQYAINERPFDDGFVQLGATFATDGTYTIALTRNDMESVFLTDLLSGTTTDLTLGEYTFHTTAGTDHGRFLLSFAGEDTDAIKALTTGASADYYTIDGRHVGNNRSALGKGVYVVRSGNRSAKILVD